MTTESQQVTFLEGCADDVEPLLYSDSHMTDVKAYMPRLRFIRPYKYEGRPERHVEVTLVEFEPVAWGPSTPYVVKGGTVYGSGIFGSGVYGRGVDAHSYQAYWLREVGDDAEPLTLTWTDETEHQVLITRIAWLGVHKGPRGYQPFVQLTMVDSE